MLCLILHCCCCLIQEIDSRIWQMATSQVTMGHLDGCFNSFICDLHTVMLLISRLQALQNGHAICHTWLFNRHFGETTRKSCVFFNMFLVFFLSGRTNRSQSSTRQGWLQDIGRIQSWINPTPRTHDSVEFINKENDLTIFFNILDDIIHTLFEVTTEACPCHDIHQIKL